MILKLQIKNGKLFVKLESEDGKIIECNWTVVDQ